MNTYTQTENPSAMDRKIARKPLWFRYRWQLIGGTLVTALIVYMLIASAGGQKLRVELDNIITAEARRDRFLEYLDVEGVVQPMMSVKVNTLEGGRVERIVAEGGAMVEQGDTILVLSNTELMRTIDDERDAWERQRITFRQREIEMEQKSIDLQQQSLRNAYDLNLLTKTIALDEEEFAMGVISKAQLEVKRDEYEFNKANTALQRERLRRDSITSRLQQELMRGEAAQAEKAFQRTLARAGDLVVRAPVAGQLSTAGIVLTPGQQVGASATIGEIKILDAYKLTSRLDEYYLDRITDGLPATAISGGEHWPLIISKVAREVNERSFDVDLVFGDRRPENVRIGETFRVRIELDRAGEAVIIPRGDFYSVTGGQWIFKINDAGTKAVRVPITIGRQNPQHYEVTSGLENGDRVILSGYNTFGEAAELILK